MSYDAFISYSHLGDREFALALRAGVERFAKPWYRQRESRLFVDTTSLTVAPALWSTIEHELSEARWLVVLASPRAATSAGVDRELRWWIEHRGSDRILLLLVDGELAWDQEALGFDPQASTALPLALAGAFAEEPLWFDASPAAAGDRRRLDEAVVAVAAALRGVPRDELEGMALREHRRTMRTVRGVVTTLVVLLIGAVVAVVVALNQRGEAVAQSKVALARQLAALAENNVTTDLDVAMLLAVEAYRADPSPQTRRALLTVNTASPQLVRFLQADREVVTVEGSADGRIVVAGLRDGRVVRWQSIADRPREVLRLRKPVGSVSVSGDGTVIAASDGTAGALWRAGRKPAKLAVPPGQDAGDVAVSPSGRTIAIRGAARVFGAAESVTVAPADDLERATVYPDAGERLNSTASIVAVSDRELMLLDTGYGYWERRLIDGWKLEDSSSASFGTRQYGGTMSSDGGRLTVTNGASTIPVWELEGETDPFAWEYAAEAPISQPTALALSSDGARLAVADSGVVHVARVAAAGERPAAAVALRAQGSVTGDGLRFFGDGARLLSASGSSIAVWDLDRLDRLAHMRPVDLEFGCTACDGPSVAVAPDGEQLAVMSGDGTAGFVEPLDGEEGGTASEVGGSFLDYQFGQPLWAPDGKFVALPTSPPAGGVDVDAPADLPDTYRAWPAGDGTEPPLAAAMRDDGSAILVDGRGAVYWQDAETGEIVDTMAGPEDLALGGDQLQDAAIEPDAALLATIDRGIVTIDDLDTRKRVTRLPGADATHVAFGGSLLLVQREAGSVEVWDQRGTALERTLPGDGSYSWPPVPDEQGALVARRRSDGTVAIDDLHTGARLVGLATPRGKSVSKTGVAFTPAGNVLVTVSEDDGFGSQPQLVWRDLSDRSLVETACDAVGRDLTEGEWRGFVGTDPPDELACGAAGP
jgi:WD40 repeat protein